jgi:hypothetical protein
MATEGIITFLLKDHLGTEQRRVTAELCLALAVMSAPAVDKELTHIVARKIAHVNTRKEELFPEFINVST